MNMHIYKNGYCPSLYQKGSSLNTIYVMLLDCVEALFAEMIYMRTLSQFDKILSMACIRNRFKRQTAFMIKGNSTGQMVTLTLKSLDLL